MSALDLTGSVRRQPSRPQRCWQDDTRERSPLVRRCCTIRFRPRRHRTASPAGGAARHRQCPGAGCVLRADVAENSVGSRAKARRRVAYEYFRHSPARRPSAGCCREASSNARARAALARRPRCAADGFARAAPVIVERLSRSHEYAKEGAAPCCWSRRTSLAPPSPTAVTGSRWRARLHEAVRRCAPTTSSPVQLLGEQETRLSDA